jgi:hypothetical protein
MSSDGSAPDVQQKDGPLARRPSLRSAFGGTLSSQNLWRRSKSSRPGFIQVKFVREERTELLPYITPAYAHRAAIVGAVFRASRPAFLRSSIFVWPSAAASRSFEATWALIPFPLAASQTSSSTARSTAVVSVLNMEHPQRMEAKILRFEETAIYIG